MHDSLFPEWWRLEGRQGGPVHCEPLSEEGFQVLKPCCHIIMWSGHVEWSISCKQPILFL